MTKWFVTIRDVSEFTYVVEAGDMQSAQEEAEKLFAVDGGPQHDFIEFSARKVRNPEPATNDLKQIRRFFAGGPLPFNDR